MKKLFFYALIAFTLCSCDTKRIYESNVAIPADGWRRLDLVRFEVEITDTINPCNIYINVRNNNKYLYMDFWLFVNVRSPFGTVERDTALIRLADHRGKWLGHGLGSKFDSRIFLRRNVRFPVPGTYIFEYEHGMRDEPLIGIEDVGLRIECRGVSNTPRDVSNTPRDISNTP